MKSCYCRAIVDKAVLKRKLLGQLLPRLGRIGLTDDAFSVEAKRFNKMFTNIWLYSFYKYYSGSNY